MSKEKNVGNFWPTLIYTYVAYAACVAVCHQCSALRMFVHWDVARATSAAMKGSLAIIQANCHQLLRAYWSQCGSAVMQRDATQRHEQSPGPAGSHKSANKQEEPQEVRQAKCSILKVLN